MNLKLKESLKILHENLDSNQQEKLEQIVENLKPSLKNEQSLNKQFQETPRIFESQNPILDTVVKGKDENLIQKNQELEEKDQELFEDQEKWMETEELLEARKVDLKNLVAKTLVDSKLI